MILKAIKDVTIQISLKNFPHAIIAEEERERKKKKKNNSGGSGGGFGG